MAFVTASILCTIPFRSGAATIGAALTEAVRGAGASAVVIDLNTGTVLASEGPAVSGTPGSTLKPLLLQYALDHGIVRPETQIYCRRNLHIAGRSVACTHPADQPVFDAERALAESCNTWFADMARQFTARQLEDALQSAHLRHASMREAGIDQRQLTVLGLSGVATTPMELARAYLDLLKRVPPGGVVEVGLRESVETGMANPAAVPGMLILGKTGTAANPRETWTHGWFVGALPGRLVIVIYVPHSDGGAAARLAHKFFANLTPLDSRR